jgi:hypothetical protein
MAQTKTRTTRARRSPTNSRRASASSGRTNRATRNRSNAKGRPAQATRTSARSNARSGSTKATRARSNARRAQANGGAQSPSPTVVTRAKSVRDSVTSEAQDAARGVASFAKKAKAPLLAGGAGAAGVAAALAVRTRSRRRRKVLGVSLPKTTDFKVDAKKVTEAIADAAKRADRFGQNMSRVASGVQDVSETANKAAKKS